MVLIAENLMFTKPTPPFPEDHSSDVVQDAYVKWGKDNGLAKRLILASLNATFHKLVVNLLTTREVA